ncbi:hypothetical protein F5Y17DRAFT_435582 [Xylariaceae sp. FL0594]|nr:hypothetical protein F5Y17DRAFT_435582 [Xylariaceae sp. FL0594]
MPFPYQHICDLLQQLHDETCKPPGKQTSPDLIIKAWFQRHRALFDAPGTDVSAIISTLLPERRTDRVYNIQAPRLQSIFGKTLLLGASRVSELRRWLEPGSSLDLGDCVECILSRTPNSRDDTSQITVEEIDNGLSRLAATCRFSSPAVRALHPASDSESRDPSSILGRIYSRLGSRDAKWFTRLVLKNYQPVVLDSHAVFRNYHPLLPQMMKIRDDISVATAFVRHIDESSHDPTAIARILKPRLGTKVGRPPWFKGRSIKHCMDMLRGRDFACEKKMDGEYCQIHVDLSKRHNPIQIFSKSGKDSTADRVHLHQAIRDSLKIGREDCPFSKGCILEGELVVYSTKEHKILPFHKIRKHVSRSGSFIGTANDSQAHEHEKLMIIYFDILLVDDESLLGMKNSERFQELREVVTCRKGQAELVSRTVISASHSAAAPTLRELFAQCIASRGEGLVLKPDEPYFDFSTRGGNHGCFIIKLKKEYVQGWGDVGDFAVIGASYDAAKAKEYRMPNVKWTHFFIGCLENKDQARAKSEIPRFKVTNIVELTGPTLSSFWSQRSVLSVPYKENMSFEVDYSRSMLSKRPTEIFPRPLVFDMRCFAFDKEPNNKFWSMRFPQVSKVHHDRSYLDTISFSELQDIAEATAGAAGDADSQEMRHWVKALEKLDKKTFIDMTSQSTARSDDAPPSPSSVSSESSESSHASPARLPPTYQTRPNPPEAPSSLGGDETASGTESDSDSSTVSTPRQTKRRITEHSDINLHAKRCCTSSPTRPHFSSQSSFTKLMSPTRPACSQYRRPLSQVNTNITKHTMESQAETPPPSSSSQPVQHAARDGENQPLPSSPPLRHTASEMTASPSKVAGLRRYSTTDLRLVAKPSAETPQCSFAGHECYLAHTSVLLAPCISSYAWVTDNLLTQHGIADPLLDPRVWKFLDPPSKSFTSSHESGKVETETKDETDVPHVRKICLVETRRKEATTAFIEKIKAVDLKRPNGDHEWVTVYDWKVLETLTELEAKGKGKGSCGGKDPWRTFYVGLV